ncbi:alpha/beta hydrolase [Massilia sp. W12]|uniref:alpha/beta fold hydrolase n=1 Tax=Massilia sp. W12 TaxID=3126507 RepID=UPI0030D48664
MMWHKTQRRYERQAEDDSLLTQAAGQGFRFVERAGVRLCYRTDGDAGGVPLLLVMGLGMQLISWPPELVQGLVRAGYFVIRLDNRDAGLSSHLPHLGRPNLPLAYVKSIFRLPLRAPYLLSDMALDCLAVLDDAGVRQAHLAGASMGGMIVQLIAAMHPGRCLSLTSIMSTSGRRGLPGPVRAARRVMLSGPKPGASQEELLDYSVNVWRVLGSPGFPFEEAQLRQRIAAGLARSFNPQGTARQLLAVAASGSRVALLPQVKARALVMHGRQDPLLPLACGEDCHRLLPNSSLRIFEGMGHDLPHALLPDFVSMIDAHCQGRSVPWQSVLP